MATFRADFGGENGAIHPTSGASRTPPPANVLEAFGQRDGEWLAGGQGQSFRAGDVVLKPVMSEVEAEWAADLLTRVKQDGFEVAAPVRTPRGWVVDGWTGFRFVDGNPVSGERYADRLAACAAFHRALADVHRPGFLDSREDPWSTADRIVFEGAPWSAHPRLREALLRLERLVKPIASGQQVIHGDITGNFLSRGSGPLTVIDFTPYWRPARFADAIVVVDCVVWESAPFEIADLAGLDAEFYQLLLRAALRRLYEVDCHHRLRRLPDSHLAQVDAYAGLVRSLEERAPNPRAVSGRP